MKTLQIDNVLDVFVGQNATENWKLIDKYHKCNFMWFHLEDYPSCHVFVENDALTPEDIYELSKICKDNTYKCKDKNNVKVCYTHISNIKKGKDPGSVIFKNINLKKIVHV